ncbi:hypothetical protein UA08_00768 [Talaromyces atroroseus]|uniref:DASH complex subunit ASK1 n=1 Tax=Talaromyces atroroseus TaxID=1441469 RepID=A0A225B8G4_TALAT|nr:hypothetical protein UA08_00768 [Talaromyces atroroseus]OKL64379.1 hypothetical protein UA08_00768 [Talaromyces atroroseus]
MSGPAQRNLTLTEELEKLEQSITLTLQEIDSNFSRAHRIVTTSILPIVEQYAEHSKDVWEGAKFWKQFFEASANVSLSGYEENPNEDTTEHEQTATTITEEESSTNITQNTSSLEEEVASYQTPSSEHLDLGHHQHPDESELDLSSLTISPSHSTPRAPGKMAQLGGGDETPSSSSVMGGYSPPTTYGEENSRLGEHDESTLPDNDAPVTPGRYAGRYHQSAADVESDTPMSSPFIPPPTTSSRNQQPSTSTMKNYYQKPTDPILHHVLDKTYRVQATPLSKKGAGLGAGAAGTFKPTKFSVMTPKRKPAYDSSPLSSPELEAPKLHEEIFASPINARKNNSNTRTPNTPRTRIKPQRSRTTPRPGTSVLTPGNNKNKNNSWDSDDDADDRFGAEFDDDDDDDTATGLGVSPPKTMQFHIPHSRLMKTPAKEASKRIVSDLLATAGGGTGTSSSIYNDDDDSFQLETPQVK